MPITSTNRVSFGKIPAAQEVEPRTNILSPAPQAMETMAQREQNAALTSFRAASAVGDVGREVAALGVAFLQPLDKLNQSRKVLQADQIALQTILDGRRMAQAAQTDVDYRQHSAVVEAEWSRMEADALQKARPLGNAAVASLSTRLGEERLRLFTNAQQYAIGRDRDAQVGMVQQSDTFYRQEITRTLNEAERVAIIARHRDVFDTAAQQGLILSADAEKKEKQDFYLFTIKQNAIMVGRAGNLLDARTYLRSKDIGADLEREYENAVEDALSYDLEQEAKQERTDAKLITAAQDHLFNTFTYDMHRTTEVPKLIEMKRTALDASRTGSLHGTQASTLIERLERRIEELLKPGPPPKDDEPTKHRIADMVLTAPETTDERVIWDTPGLTSDTRISLSNQRRLRLNERHFMNQSAYKLRVDQLEAMKRPVVSNTDYFSGIQGQQGQAETDLATTVASRVAAYIRSYNEMLTEEMKETYGVPKPGQIEKFDGILEQWLKDLRTTSGHLQPAPSGGSSGIADDLKNEQKITITK